MMTNKTFSSAFFSSCEDKIKPVSSTMVSHDLVSRRFRAFLKVWGGEHLEGPLQLCRCTVYSIAIVARVSDARPDLYAVPVPVLCVCRVGGSDFVSAGPIDK